MDLLKRLAVKQQIRQCTNCSLHTVAIEPVPFTGPSPAQIAIIGEAPGRYEDVQHRPFVGPSGQLARQWLADIGIDDNTVAWLNVVSCYPNRTPTSREVEACRDNLASQLAIIQPDFAIVFGSVATSAFCGSSRIGEIRGLWWRLPYESNGSPFEAWAIATWHPAAILRNRDLEKDVVADLARFRSLSPLVSDKCVKCKVEWAVEWVNDFGYCYRHNLLRQGLAYGRKSKFEKDKKVSNPGKRQTKLV